MRKSVRLLKECLKSFVLGASFLLQAEQAIAGEYHLLDRWPTGINENLAFMRPDDKPLCQSLASAVNQNAHDKPFDANTRLDGHGVAELGWQQFEGANPLQAAREILLAHRRYWTGATSLDKLDAFQLDEKFLAGSAHVKSLVAPGFSPAEPSTHLLMLDVNLSNHRVGDPIYFGGEMARVDESVLNHLVPIIVVGPVDDRIFTYSGHSYLLGSDLRDRDNAFKMLRKPQPEIYAYRGSVPVCRMVWENEAQHKAHH